MHSGREIKLFCFWLFLILISSDLSQASRKGHKSTAVTKTTSREVEFAAPMENVSVPVGKDAVFTCRVNKAVRSDQLQLVWIRLDSQTILAFENRLVQNNPRISVSHEDRQEFTLHIRSVQPEDRGHYACQINTNPLSQMRAYLDVLVPPIINVAETTEYVLVREASNVSLKCSASGHPQPLITWSREDGLYITPRNDEKALTHNGSVLTLERVSRADMATYICVADNGVPPAVSQRITVKVEFPPMIWVEPKHVAAWQGGSASLRCETEAYPQAMHYWYRDGVVLTNTEKYEIRNEPAPEPQSYRTRMHLTIRDITSKDFGDYTCSANNFHGNVEGAVKLYEIEAPPEGRTTHTTKGKSTHRGGNKKKGKGKGHTGEPGSEEKSLYDKQQMDQEFAAIEDSVKSPIKKKDASGSSSKLANGSSLLSVLIVVLFHKIFSSLAL